MDAPCTRFDRPPQEPAHHKPRVVTEKLFSRKTDLISSDDPLVKVNQAFLFSAHPLAFIPKTMAGMGSPVQGVSYMRKSVFVLAVIGTACSSVAFAGEVKQTKAPTPVVKATTMSDAYMDKVTAGGGPDNTVFLPSQANGVGKNVNGNLHSDDHAANLLRGIK